MPLTVTSASTSSAQPAAARNSSSPINSFASVLDGTHDASRAAAAKPASQATNATPSADHGPKRRSSDDRHTPPAHPTEHPVAAAPVPSPLAAAPTPALISPLSPAPSLSQDTDPASQSVAFEASVTDASSAGASPSLASSPSAVLASVNSAAEAAPDAQAPDAQVADAQVADAQAPDTSADNPGASLSASNTPSFDPAKPAQAATEPSPIASDIARQPPPAAASSLPLPSSPASVATASIASLKDLLANTGHATGVEAAEAPALSPAARTATTSSNRAAAAARQQALPTTINPTLPATALPLPQPASAPSPAPAIDLTHSSFSSSGKRSSVSTDKAGSTPDSNGADSLSSTAASPSLSPSAFSINQASGMLPIPSSLVFSTPSQPQPFASGDNTTTAAQAGTLPATTAADSAAALSKVDVARLVRSTAGSELRVGVRSEDFGNLTIHATLGRDQLSAHISTESERLGAALSNHLSSIDDTLTDRLGKGLSLRTTVSVGSDTSFAGSDQGREQARQQPSPQTANPTANQTATSSNSNGNPSARYQPYPTAAGSHTAHSIATGANAAYTLASPDRLSIRV